MVKVNSMDNSNSLTTFGRIFLHMAIITLTINPSLDKTTHVDGFFPDHKLRCSTPIVEPGGGGVNVSRAIRNLGGNSLAIFLSGGANGDLFCELLEEEGVSFKAIASKANMRDNFMIHDDRNNKQFRFGFPGGPITLAEEESVIEETLKHVQAGDYLVASGSLPVGARPDFYSILGKRVKEIGAKYVLDSSKDALVRGLENGAYLIKPNWNEVAELTGVSEVKVTEQEAITMELVEQGKAEIVIASMGSQGAMIVQKGKIEYVTAPNIKKKSTVGAGDSMLAAIIFKLSIGWDLKEAVMYGTAAGSSAAAQPGTKLCQLKQTENLFEYVKSQSS